MNGQTVTDTHLKGRLRDLDKMCESKMRYATPRAAQDAIRGMVRHGKARNMRIYRCANCQGWHITRK